MKLAPMVAMGIRTLGYQLLGKRCPVNVMLAVTNRCNGRCAYCRIPSRSPEDLSTATVLSLIDQMKEAGTARLGIWGGEPLVRDDIGEIVSYAAGKGMYVTLDTNGLLWKERRDQLADLDHVMISIDGDRAAHEANRGEGTFERTMEALELAAADRHLKVWTLTVLTKNNLDQVDFLLKTAERLRVRASFQVLHHNDKLGRNHDQLIPSNEDYTEVLHDLLRRKREGARIGTSTRCLKYLLKWENYAQSRKAGPHCGLRCKAGGLYCNIDANGNVFACSLLADEVTAVNAVDQGFKRAFDAIPTVPCQGCTASCFTEYNYLYRLDPVCICEWIQSTRD